jgi:hypothetical protein
MKTNRMMQRPASAGFPESLTTWFSERQLLNLVLDAVQAVEMPPTNPVAGDGRGLRPKMMLTLLTYCYATNLVSSEDVVRSFPENQTVRYVCAHHFPKWNEIRLFRRHHREDLRRCLIQVYQQAWAARLDDGQASFEGCDWFETVLRAEVERLVDRKFEQAILLDWANLED